MATLFELSDEIRQVEQALAAVEDDDEAIKATIEGYLANMQGKIGDKLDGYCNLIHELTGRSKLRARRAKEIASRAAVDANKVKRLKEALAVYFDMNKYKVQETPEHRITLANNGGKIPLMLTVEPECLPEEYVIHHHSLLVNTDALRHALVAGVAVEGARLGERGIRILIK